MKILVSTGCVVRRPDEFDFSILKDIAETVGCDGFEFMMFTALYDKVDEVVQCLTENEIHTPVVHCDKHIGEYLAEGTDGAVSEALHMFNVNCKLAVQIHAKKVVLHLWSGRISDQYFENNLSAYEALKQIANDYELDLLIENVVCNKETPMRRLMQLVQKYPDIHFTYDTKMAAFHGEENLIYEKDYEWLWKGAHVKHFHINDYGSTPMDWERLLGDVLPVGAGHLDFDRFFVHLKKLGYDDTLTIEATASDSDGRIDCEMLKRCVGKVQKLLGRCTWTDRNWKTL